MPCSLYVQIEERAQEGAAIGDVKLFLKLIGQTTDESSSQWRIDGSVVQPSNTDVLENAALTSEEKEELGKGVSFDAILQNEDAALGTVQKEFNEMLAEAEDQKPKEKEVPCFVLIDSANTWNDATRSAVTIARN